MQDQPTWKLGTPKILDYAAKYLSVYFAFVKLAGANNKLRFVTILVAGILSKTLVILTFILAINGIVIFYGEDLGISLTEKLDLLPGISIDLSQDALLILFSLLVFILFSLSGGIIYYSHNALALFSYEQSSRFRKGAALNFISDYKSVSEDKDRRRRLREYLLLTDVKLAKELKILVRAVVEALQSAITLLVCMCVVGYEAPYIFAFLSMIALMIIPGYLLSSYRKVRELAKQEKSLRSTHRTEKEHLVDHLIKQNSHHDLCNGFFESFGSDIENKLNTISKKNSRETRLLLLFMYIFLGILFPVLLLIGIYGEKVGIQITIGTLIILAFVFRFIVGIVVSFLNSLRLISTHFELMEEVLRCDRIATDQS